MKSIFVYDNYDDNLYLIFASDLIKKLVFKYVTEMLKVVTNGTTTVYFLSLSKFFYFVCTCLRQNYL